MQPTSSTYWLDFHLLIVALLAVELLYARRRRAAAMQATAIVVTALWIVAALLFAVFIARAFGPTAATQYLAAYAIEQALSLDNLFVFLLLFRLFQIEARHQPRVLFWGVAGAIVLRGAFIAGGLGLLARFHLVSYLFAVVLLAAAIRLMLPQKASPSATPVWIAWLARLHPVSLRQDRFFVRESGRSMMTVLTLALIAIELTDVVFALDSIPAVLSITRQPFIAYTSNIMAVMGLRSLYFVLAHLLGKLRLLHYGLAAVLVFAAVKLLAAPWLAIGPLASLAVVLGLLAATVALSIYPRPPRSAATT